MKLEKIFSTVIEKKRRGEKCAFCWGCHKFFESYSQLANHYWLKLNNGTRQRIDLCSGCFSGMTNKKALKIFADMGGYSKIELKDKYGEKAEKEKAWKNIDKLKVKKSSKHENQCL